MKDEASAQRRDGGAPDGDRAGEFESPAFLRLRDVLLASAPAVFVALVVLEPRFRHFFPSMIDDWSAVERSPSQLREVLSGGNPEELRYRPGFIAWNALQWHTFGAPRSFVGPQLWGVLRIVIFVLGSTAFAATIAQPQRRRHGGTRAGGWTVVALVPAALIATPGSLSTDERQQERHPNQH
jgi:hypothetical protein